MLLVTTLPDRRRGRRARARDAADHHGDQHGHRGERAAAGADQHAGKPHQPQRDAAAIEHRAHQHEHRQRDQRVLGDAGVDIGGHRHQVGAHHDDRDRARQAERDSDRHAAPAAGRRTARTDGGGHDAVRPLASSRTMRPTPRTITARHSRGSQRDVDPLRMTQAGRQHLEAVVVPGQLGAVARRSLQKHTPAAISDTSSARRWPARTAAPRK